MAVAVAVVRDIKDLRRLTVQREGEAVGMPPIGDADVAFGAEDDGFVQGVGADGGGEQGELAGVVVEDDGGLLIDAGAAEFGGGEDVFGLAEEG